MSERLDLFLAPSDLWRRHGLLNVIVTLGSPVAGLAVAVLLVVGRADGVLPIVVLATMLAAPLTNRQVLRSALAIVSRRPYLTLSASGLYVDGCVFDSLYFAWSDVEAMSPELASIEAALRSGSLVAITLRVRSGSKRERTFSSFQHSIHRSYFEIAGFFVPPSAPILEAVARCFGSQVERHEPFLLSDMPD